MSAPREVPTQLLLRVLDEPDRGVEWTDKEALRLRSDLREASRIPVDPAETPETASGARGVGAELIGTLIVLLPTVQYLTPILDTVLTWLEGRRRRRVHVKLGNDEITIEGAELDEARKLISTFVARNRRRASSAT